MAKTQVRDCDCVSSILIVVKSAGAKKDACPRTEIPWFNRENGAKFQDGKYGKGRRLHNVTDSSKSPQATCTVCGKHKQV